MRRLYLHIYFAFLAIGVAAMATAFVAGRWVFVTEVPSSRPQTRGAAALLAAAIPADAPPAVQAARLTEFADTLHIGLVLWDRANQPLATPGVSLPPPDPSAPEVEWQHRDRRSVVRVRLADGRHLGVVFPGDGFPGASHVVGVLAVLVLTIAVLCYPLARRMTRRLEQLQRGVDTFGAGDLGARVAIAGRDEIAALAGQFNRAAGRIEALVAGQRRMLASASHELRSPLARVRMAVELLADAAPGQRAVAEGAVADILELDALVGDLLLASRLEARPPERAPLDLAALAAEEAARAGASYMSSGTAMIDGEAAAVRRLVRNLLDNARRHGAPPIELAVAAVEAGWRITVDDRGPGIAAGERERIFEAFYRPDGHREGDGGVGLGLALVRQIAGHHGGSAACEDRPGGGNRFIVVLPRRSAVATGSERIV